MKLFITLTLKGLKTRHLNKKKMTFEPTYHKQLHQIKHFVLYLICHAMSNNPTISKTSYVVCFY